MRAIPDVLSASPFTREQARAAGVTDRMLQGNRFVRVLPGVWAVADLDLTWAARLQAARLALPDRAQPTGITRLQMAGLTLGPWRPLHFVVEGDLHLALPGVFLHRTRRLAPLDDEGVATTGAFLAYCARARVIDAIKVGDWLLSRGLVTRPGITALALADPWRDGAHEAIWVCDHLRDTSRSPRESELRALLVFAGLPEPEANVELVLDGVLVVPDLLYRGRMLVLEYQGVQHQEERAVYVADLDRQELLRAHGYACLEVTKERLAHGRTVVGRVYRELVARGYTGPAPRVDDRWSRLFAPLSRQVGPRVERSRAA